MGVDVLEVGDDDSADQNNRWSERIARRRLDGDGS